MKDTKQQLDELRQDVERNPSPEGRATTFVERVSRMYREASVANDWEAVRAITAELSRDATGYGAAIAAGKAQSGHASGA